MKFSYVFSEELLHSWGSYSEEFLCADIGVEIEGRPIIVGCVADGAEARQQNFLSSF